MTVHRSVRRYGPKRGARVDPSGYDAGTEVEGKKRHILVGTLGLLLTAVIHPADVQDRDGVLPVLRAARRPDRHPVERTPGCGGMARTLGRTTRTVPLRVDGVVGRWRGSIRPRVARRLSGRARADSIRVRDARGGPGIEDAARVDGIRATAEAVPAVALDGVGRAFPGGIAGGLVRAVDDVSLAIRRNEFFTLLGPSGCGKTTLLRLVAGFEQPTTGRIRLGGRDVGGLPPFRRPVNTVFQSYALFPHLTVAQNVAFGLKMLGRPAADMAARVDLMLGLVRMGEMAQRSPATLSGGQQQRVALARALAPEPQVLLLDEPLSALDLKLRKAMQLELKRLQRKTGITFVFVTHDQEEALTMSDRVAVMDRGRVLQVGTPREIYDHPAERFVADFIGEVNMLDGWLLRAADGAGTVRLGSVGPEVAARVPQGAPASGAVTVIVRPEHASLSRDPGALGLDATLAGAVYVGTDTLYHLALVPGGEPFVVRRQNGRAGDGDAFRSGERLRIVIDDRAVQVLKD